MPRCGARDTLRRKRTVATASVRYGSRKVMEPLSLCVYVVMLRGGRAMKRAGERSVFAVFRNSFVTTTLAFVVVGTFVAAPGLAKPPVGNPKPFYATVTPSSVGGGTSVPFQLSIVNEST